jgi:YesN/AraC family two-component response regulator
MRDQISLLAGRKLLVADDEQFSLSLVVRMLRKLGCTDIVQSADGATTLEHLRAGGKSLWLVILDFNMPEVNGLQILKMIRTGKASVPSDINVLMLTGNSDFALVGAAMALDVDAFVIKPVSLVTLTSRLDKIRTETREIKSIETYEAIEIDTIGKRLLSHRPVGTTRPKTETQKAHSLNGMAVKLESVKVGAVLAESIHGPNGELLLGRATVLNERLLRRLKELQGALNLEYLYIYPPGQKHGS